MNQNVPLPKIQSMVLVRHFCVRRAELILPAITESRIDCTTFGAKFKLTLIMELKPKAAEPKMNYNRNLANKLQLISPRPFP